MHPDAVLEKRQGSISTLSVPAKDCWMMRKIEMIGISRTPMGFILEQLGAINEAAS